MVTSSEASTNWEDAAGVAWWVDAGLSWVTLYLLLAEKLNVGRLLVGGESFLRKVIYSSLLVHATLSTARVVALELGGELVAAALAIAIDFQLLCGNLLVALLLSVNFACLEVKEELRLQPLALQRTSRFAVLAWMLGLVVAAILGPLELRNLATSSDWAEEDALSLRGGNWTVVAINETSSLAAMSTAPPSSLFATNFSLSAAAAAASNRLSSAISHSEGSNRSWSSTFRTSTFAPLSYNSSSFSSLRADSPSKPGTRYYGLLAALVRIAQSAAHVSVFLYTLQVLVPLKQAMLQQQLQQQLKSASHLRLLEHIIGICSFFAVLEAREKFYQENIAVHTVREILCSWKVYIVLALCHIQPLCPPAEALQIQGDWPLSTVVGAASWYDAMVPATCAFLCRRKATISQVETEQPLISGNGSHEFCSRADEGANGGGVAV